MLAFASAPTAAPCQALSLTVSAGLDVKETPGHRSRALQYFRPEAGLPPVWHRKSEEFTNQAGSEWLSSMGPRL